MRNAQPPSFLTPAPLPTPASPLLPFPTPSPIPAFPQLQQHPRSPPPLQPHPCLPNLPYPSHCLAPPPEFPLSAKGRACEPRHRPEDLSRLGEAEGGGRSAAPASTPQAWPPPGSESPSLLLPAAAPAPYCPLAGHPQGHLAYLCNPPRQGRGRQGPHSQPCSSGIGPCHP